MLWLVTVVFVVAGLFVLRKGRPVEPAFGVALVAVGLLVGFGSLNALVR